MALQGMALASGMGSGFLGLAQLGYGIYQDQRDFKYTQEQADLARKREDSAIQRRVKDAIKAGINPYDAIGSGAGAGAGPSASFSSRSLPNGPNFGATFDYMIQAEKLNQEREFTKQAKQNTKLGQFAVGDAYRNDEYQNLAFKYNTGMDMSYHYDNGFDSYLPMMNASIPANMNISDYMYNQPYINAIRMNYENAIYNHDMLRKENAWYTTNQILDAINSGTGSVGNIFGAFGKAGSGYRDFGFGYKFRNNEPIIKPRIGFYE